MLSEQALRTDRSDSKPATAIRTDIVQTLFHTIPAEGAFEAADHGLGRIGRQILVATFAVGTHFKHHDLTYKDAEINVFVEYTNP